MKKEITVGIKFTARMLESSKWAPHLQLVDESGAAIGRPVPLPRGGLDHRPDLALVAVDG